MPVIWYMYTTVHSRLLKQPEDRRKIMYCYTARASKYLFQRWYSRIWQTRELKTERVIKYPSPKKLKGWLILIIEHAIFAGIERKVWIVTCSCDCCPILAGITYGRWVEWATARREGGHDISLRCGKCTWTISSTWPNGRCSRVSTMHQVVQFDNTPIEQAL